MLRRNAIAFLLIGAVACGAATQEGPLGFLRATQEADAPYQNAVYLYLRLAGIVWIAVEWIAALVLWRAYRRLRAHLERMETAP